MFEKQQREKYFLDSRAVSGVSFDIDLQSEWTFPCRFSYLLPPRTIIFPWKCFGNTSPWPLSILNKRFRTKLGDFSDDVVQAYGISHGQLIGTFFFTLSILSFFLSHLHVFTIIFTKTKWTLFWRTRRVWSSCNHHFVLTIFWDDTWIYISHIFFIIRSVNWFHIKYRHIWEY